MDIQIDQHVIDTVCNSLRASKQSLRNQLQSCEAGRSKKGKKEIIESQLADVEEAIRVFEYFES